MIEAVKMPVHHTNITKDYALSAGFKDSWSGIREILQNALDSRDKGFALTVKFDPATNSLKILNHGITLNSDALVIGFSTKQDDPKARGQHGEGLVVGLNALLNYGHSVQVKTASETWTPKHIKNENGLEVLVFNIENSSDFQHCFEVNIEDVTPELWELCKNKVLWLNKKINIVKTNCGNILLDPQYRNKLFVKGIYVCDLSEGYEFGYNLDGIELNRDREVADPFYLNHYIKESIMDAVNYNKIDADDILKILENEKSGESILFANTRFWGDASIFHEKISANFTERHGDDALPVNTAEDTCKVSNFGKKGVTVSRAVKNIIEKLSGTLEDRLHKEELNVKYVYDNLTDKESINLSKVIDLINLANDNQHTEKIVYGQNLSIVNFVGDATLGTVANVETSPKIYISRKILQSHSTLVETMVREYSKMFNDGDMKLQLSIMSRIIESLIKSPSIFKETPTPGDWTTDWGSLEEGEFEEGELEIGLTDSAEVL